MEALFRTPPEPQLGGNDTISPPLHIHEVPSAAIEQAKPSWSCS